MGKTLYILTASIDEGVTDLWSFWAESEMQIAEHIMADPWNYRDFMDRLRVNMRDVDNLAPADLLEYIHRSRVDGDSESGFEFHRIRANDIVTVAGGEQA